jgi:hypothetical protein
MIPLKLKLIPQEITVPKTGMKKTVFVLTLAHDEIKLEDILKAAGQTLNKILLPDFDFDEAPDDLIAETILTSAPVHTEEPPPENPENETEPETDPRDAEIERLFTEMEIAPGKRRAMLGVPNLDKDALILKLQGLGQGLVQPLNVTKPQENKPAEQAPTTSRVPERSEAPVKVTPVATPKNGPQNLKSAEKKTRAVSQSLF